jgi:hypothetical protein
MLFDRNKLYLKALSERKHDLDITIVKELDDYNFTNIPGIFYAVAERVIHAKENRSATILFMGAHVIRSGVQKYIVDLMERGYISCVAMNGGGMIHDYEFGLIGATTENVARYIKEGQFGLWKETAQLNDVINQAYKENRAIGMGEAIGYHIEKSNLPYKLISILAAGYRLSIPVTVHVGIGYDIIHEHPNFDGAATGALSYNDFLKFVSVVQNLENGVVMNFGSAVMAPEVFLKALSMARNVAHQGGKVIQHFTTVVFDLYNLPEDCSKEPPKDNQVYYFRPWKTMLARAVTDGGASYYIRGKHADTIPGLWAALNKDV